MVGAQCAPILPTPYAGCFTHTPNLKLSRDRAAAGTGAAALRQTQHTARLRRRCSSRIAILALSRAFEAGERRAAPRGRSGCLHTEADPELGEDQGARACHSSALGDNRRQEGQHGRKQQATVRRSGQRAGRGGHGGIRGPSGGVCLRGGPERHCWRGEERLSAPGGSPVSRDRLLSGAVGCHRPVPRGRMR